MEINAVVSENARRLREEKRLTLDEAARLTGVSRSMLAQIEKGDVNPTISMVWNRGTTSVSHKMRRPHTPKQVMSMGCRDSPAPRMAPERISMNT